MPCRYDESPEEMRRNREANQHNAEVKALKENISQLETLLCGSSRVLERYEYDFAENPELDLWWSKHRKKDETRRKKEQKEQEKAKKDEWIHNQALELMDKPLSAMTEEEKKILREAGVL